MHNFRSVVLVSSMLAIIGGILMVTSGYATHSFLLPILNVAQGKLPQYLSGVPGLTVALAIDLVYYLIALGGFTVILGGIAIMLERRTTGRFLIMLGGGAGVIGFVLSLGYAAYEFGPAVLTAYASYWIGVVLAIFGRRLAKRA